MQQQILEKYPTANIRVYAVWFNMLPQDRRDGWDAGLMPDSRVTHFWDEQRLVSRWVARQIEQTEGFAWDTYLLYGPDASWTEVPSPLRGTGRPVIRLRRELAEEITPLLTR